MNEPDFERELDALYAEPQSFTDEADFASSLERALRLSHVRRAAVLSICAVSGAGLTLVSLSITDWLVPLQNLLSFAFGSGTGDGYWLFEAAMLLLVPPLLRSVMETNR